MRKTISVLLLFLFLTFPIFTVLAVDVPDYCQQTPIPDDKVNECISTLTNKGSELQDQANTLSAQIAQFDSQILLTRAKISQAQATLDQLIKEIDALSTRIGYVATSVDNLEVLLKQRIIATYEQGFVSNLEIVLSSQSFSDFILRAQYLKQVQENDRKILTNLQETKANYANQKDERQVKQAQIEASKKQLEGLQISLSQQKATKDELLAETQGSETTYQRLLAAAKAQLAGFSSFAANQGGASLLSGQTSCDDWGCYYNQRDSQWGSTALNSSVGTPYSIASDGCLVTSMAMMLTHLGHRSVTPVTINSNPNNFASYYPAYLKYSISADNLSVTRKGHFKSEIDSLLAGGKSLIVGIQYPNSQDTHFMVFISGSNGDYTINDPFAPNGHNVKFSDHYSYSWIFEVDEVVPI